MSYGLNMEKIYLSTIVDDAVRGAGKQGEKPEIAVYCRVSFSGERRPENGHGYIFADHEFESI